MEDKFRKIHNNLPIFSIAGDVKSIIYTPGIVKVYPAKLVMGLNDISDFNKHTKITKQLDSDINQIIVTAENSKRSWSNHFDREFKPECLTIYPGNACNLNCKYCFTKEKDEKTIDKEFVKAAAGYAAEYCAREKRTLYLVFHGGGEPTFHWTLLQDLYKIVYDICLKYKVPVFSYIATNGIFSETQASWLAKHFNRIGVSCDGFPEIQDSYRYGSSIKITSSILKKNLSSLLKLNNNIDIRVTITPVSMVYMEEIAKYFIEELNIKNIRMEPVYSYGDHGFNPEDAGTFANNLMKAIQLAKKSGATVSYSGVRLNELHSCYCDVLRNTIRLTPDNKVINCFFDSTSKVVKPKHNKIGGMKKGGFEINYIQVREIKEVLRELPEHCLECINIYHCSRACPEYCVLSKKRNIESNLKRNFRCLLNKELALRFISERVYV